MKRISQLTAAAAALCLLLAPASPMTAETAVEPAASAETVWWSPRLIGSWIGVHQGTFLQFTFNPDGTYAVSTFENPTLERLGGMLNLENADAMTFGKGTMLLTSGGMTNEFRRMLNPYARVNDVAETAAESADPDLVGTYGGRMKGTYVEWTFHGDGRFTQITPLETLKEDGSFLAGGGEIALLFKGETIRCAYARTLSALRLVLPGSEVLYLQRKAGRLEPEPPDAGRGIFTDKDMGLDTDDFAWSYTQRKPRGYVARQYFGSETDVGIPSFGYVPMVAVGDGAFKGNGAVKRVTIPALTASIGAAAFEGCESMKDVLLIGSETVILGPGLEDVKLTGAEYFAYKPNGLPAIAGGCTLKTIGEGAFRGCKSLQNLNLAESAAPSPHAQQWFIGQSGLREVNIPDGVTYIGAHAFEGCESITSLSVPESVTFIGEGAFQDCPNLALIVFRDSYPLQYAMDNGIPYAFRNK